MIDMEKVINQLETDYREAEHRGWILVPVSRKVVTNAIALLKERETKTGHWIIVEYDTLTCSCCGKFYYTGCDSTKEATANLEKGNVYRYCPHCGAKMNCESR